MGWFSEEKLNKLWEFDIYFTHVRKLQWVTNLLLPLLLSSHVCLSGYFHLLQPKAEINKQKIMVQTALDACLCCKIFCFAFLFSQLLDSLSLEKRKGNQDLRESSIPRLRAIEVIKRKKNTKTTFFFLLKFLRKEYKELNTFELRSTWNMLSYHLWTTTTQQAWTLGISWLTGSGKWWESTIKERRCSWPRWNCQR